MFDFFGSAINFIFKGGAMLVMSAFAWNILSKYFTSDHLQSPTEDIPQNELVKLDVNLGSGITSSPASYEDKSPSTVKTSNHSSGLYKS